jgi:hypothetical protein
VSSGSLINLFPVREFFQILARARMNKKQNPKPPEDLTGREFERWTVKSYAGYQRRHLWNVVCKCGKTGIVGDYQLKKRKSKSCGCYAKDRNRELNQKHGELAEGNRTPEVRAYQLAKNQCQNPAHENYVKFGGSGIKFLFSNFGEFLKAVGRRPEPGYVLTRIDRSGHYENGNVEWTKNKNRLKSIK